MRPALVKRNETRSWVHFAPMSEPNERLRLARLRKGYRSTAAAAEAFGWKKQTYKQHESGGAGSRNFAKDAERYARAYGVSAGWLMFGENPPEWAEIADNKLLLSDAIIATRPIPLVDYSMLEKVKRAGDIRLATGSEYVSMVGSANYSELVLAVQLEEGDESMSPEFKFPEYICWDLKEVPRPGKIVLAIFQSRYLVREYRLKTAPDGSVIIRLHALNSAYDSPEFAEGDGEILAVGVYQGKTL